MKIKEDLMLRNIVGEWVVVPMGERLLEFNGLMKLNDTAAFIWKLIDNGVNKQDSISAMLEEFDVDETKATHDYETFVSMLRNANILEE